MQKQTNRKGQFGKPPYRIGVASASYATTAICCRMVDRIGQSLRSLLGSCCCAGPVHDAHGRKFTSFPIGYKEKLFWSNKESQYQEKASFFRNLQGANTLIKYCDQLTKL
ncbi:hypothetical protein KO02_05325 [Sphingobacterium sp. ML3W]|uniref:hypothetical protein n=1 Tax=Sphingobacterium sp. ML3W TaxID=1538644 RepID=UPI0004F8BB9A|nr:hypothetical protein [Sphingobacterium sp. ML3W]AIM36180.1 hypothetical protein KO02_05325 [Sphingobacterium sp. ML3W]